MEPTKDVRISKRTLFEGMICPCTMRMTFPLLDDERMEVAAVVLNLCR